MLRTLSSIRMTFVLLTTLILLLGMGIILVMFEDYKQAIRLMSEIVVLDFFKAKWQDHILLTVWVLTICAASALLFLNTLLCSITRQLKAALQSATLRRWSFFIIHITFLFVLVCHGLAMVSGNKESSVKLLEGDSYVFINDLEIKVAKVQFSDNLQLVKLGPKKGRKLMTRQAFHREKNYAMITIHKDGKKIMGKKIFMLNPLKYSFIRVTLTHFFYKEKGKTNPVGVNLTITRNIFTQFFLSVYTIMIITLIVFIAITWKNNFN